MLLLLAFIVFLFYIFVVKGRFSKDDKQSQKPE